MHFIKPKELCKIQRTRNGFWCAIRAKSRARAYTTIVVECMYVSACVGVCVCVHCVRERERRSERDIERVYCRIRKMNSQTAGAAAAAALL